MGREDFIIYSFKNDLVNLMEKYNAYIFAGISETDCEQMSAVIEVDGENITIPLGDSINKNIQ